MTSVDYDGFLLRHFKKADGFLFLPVEISSLVAG